MTDSTRLPPFVRRWRAFAYTLGLVRFSVIVLIAAFTLLWVDQGQDLIRSVDDGNEFWRFIFGMLLWGFSIWLWARTLLDIRFPAPPYPEIHPDDYDAVPAEPETRSNDTGPSPELCSYNFWRKHLPRGLGVLAFVAVAAATYKAGALFLTLIALGSGVVFWLVVIYRRDVSRKLASVMKISASVSAIGCGDLPPFKSLWEALGGYRGQIALGMLLTGFVYFVVGTVSPYYLGKLGATVLLFLWAATFLPLGSTITYWSNKTGVPGLLILFIAAAVFSQWNDNHEIRDMGSFSAGVRPGLVSALKNWEADNCDNEACKPFIVVATAGGGVRAAYWTAVVLGQMEIRHPGYYKSIFAISGVSGGSVGATVFRTVATHWDVIRQSDCADTIRDCSLRIIGVDTLGPVAASMLSSDLAQRFWPWPWFPDRAAAFENAWERNYANLTGRDHLKNISFASLSRDHARPALFLNSTWSDNGRRIVASTLDFYGVEEFERSNDLLKITGKDLRLSTAMHNSARFPFVSPPGSWSDENGIIQGRLMDGGLFENYGAETAMEILDTAEKVINKSFDSYVILISSDPSLGDDLAASPHRKPLKFGYEVLSTFATYANTRVGRGSEAAARLRAYVEEKNYVHFHMCKDEATGISPPLGWSLSEEARKTILGYLVDGEGSEQTVCRPDNQEILDKVIAWLQ